MAQPSQSDVHVDAILTNISIAYIQGADVFIASKVFPIVPVEKQTNKYYKYTKGDWFRDEARLRADATESAGSGYGLSTDSYSCDVFAFHKDIGDQTRQNTDNPLNPDREATQFVTSRLMLRQEKQWAADYFTSGVWGTDVTPSNLWSDYAASDPISDVKTGRIAILKNTGFKPNTLVLGYEVYEQLKDHPDFVDRMKYTNSQVITPDIMARFFEVDRILIAQAVENTGLEGETVAMGFVHGKHALLCYVNPSPGLLAPSAGYIFSWQGVSEGLGANVGISRFRMPNLKADRVEGQIAFDDKVVATDMGYFFASVVA